MFGLGLVAIGFVMDQNDFFGKEMGCFHFSIPCVCV